MANDPFLGMLGLARRAGKLAFGDELVREPVRTKRRAACSSRRTRAKARRKKRRFMPSGRAYRCITLPHGKEHLARRSAKTAAPCARSATSAWRRRRIGKLAAQHPEYAEAAAQLAEKNARIQSRRGKKKPRERADAQRCGGAVACSSGRRKARLRGDPQGRRQRPPALAA